MMDEYDLSCDEEFRVRYYVSRIDFESLWDAAPRTNKAEIEHFYQEHDKDLWRQAYLSRDSYNYKRKILRAMHTVLASLTSLDDPVMDYGCGAGVLVHYLRKKGCTNVDAADIPSKTIDFLHAQMKQTLRRIITVDGQESFGTNEYQVIVSLDCLEHTLDPLMIIEKLLTALKPGGVLMLSFPIETDFTLAHTREAQEQRPAVFKRIMDVCDVLVPELVFRKRA
jgi:2-polyprenyl-3-methyl-5-hydroxy-6-metoxy-1,4-benzoquinol methylase